jgi:putative membrane protein
MWVGGLITCVMMEPKSSEGTKYSPFEMYAGKLLIYVIMSILQACVTLLGAYILGIYVDNYALFYFSAILVSVVFMILIYSVISALGTVGKAAIVLLLVLQISSTGGIYPIEIMAKFFQFIHPYMPMTYAIRLVREAQLGVVWSNYIPALTILLAIGLITVVCSVIVKEKADKASKYFEDRLEDSGLF